MDEQIEHRDEAMGDNKYSQINKTLLAGLDRNRKIAVAVLGFVALGVVIFWSANLKFKLNDPFTYKGNSTTPTVDQASNTSDSEAALKAKDTDGDGLSDWDEINVYHTSPYLADTDGDGIPDGVEVKNGTDPNCPQGTDCGGGTPITNSTAQDSGTGVTATSTVDYTFSADEISAIRDAFVQSGYDKAELNKLTDQEVYQAYLVSVQTHLANQGAGISAGTTSVNTDKTVSSDDAKSIRDAYIKAGYKKENLDKISDTDLVKAYKDAMMAYQNNSTSTPVRGGGN